jgi:uroporphyrinogen decarboxylase
MATTVFHAWGTLRQMTAPDAGVHGPPTLDRGADPRDAAMTRFLLESPQALARALDVIAESSANFVRHCLQAGADGIFLSVRDDWVDTADNGMETYDRLVRPTDLRILAGAAQGTFNMLHVCGKAVRFERFIEYPVHLINWADRYAGPTIAEVVARTTPVKPGTPALCAGLDNLGTLAHGTPQECAAQAVDAIQQAGSRPIMIAPGCTFDPALVPTENLLAVRQMLETASP